MLAVKARFSNDENLIEHVTQFVDKRLRKEGLPEGSAINSTNLVGSITELMAAKDAMKVVD